MVRFESDKLVIEVKTRNRNEAIDSWLMLQDELLDLMRYRNEDLIKNDEIHNVSNLMKELLLDYDTAIKLPG